MSNDLDRTVNADAIIEVSKIFLEEKDVGFSNESI